MTAPHNFMSFTFINTDIFLIIQLLCLVIGIKVLLKLCDSSGMEEIFYLYHLIVA